MIVSDAVETMRFSINDALSACGLVCLSKQKVTFLREEGDGTETGNAVQGMFWIQP